MFAHSTFIFLLLVGCVFFQSEGIRSIESSRVLQDDACDRALASLQSGVARACQKHMQMEGAFLCEEQSQASVFNATPFGWQAQLVSSDIAEKTPVLWAGFSEEDASGMASRKNLRNFVKSKNGMELAETEWGELAGQANNLEDCSWDRAKFFWKVASINMVRAMVEADVNQILIAVHKNLEGKFSFFKTVLSRAEVVYIGDGMLKNPHWRPKITVFELPTPGSPGCVVAPFIRQRLQIQAKRQVTVTCHSCPLGLLSPCADGIQVDEPKTTPDCVAGNCQNGQGTATRPGFQTYEGHFMNGQPHGHGIEIFPNGQKYEGNFQNGMKDGQGIEIYPSGAKYEGHWRNGKYDGQGKLTAPHSPQYDGQWKEDKKHGQGIMTWPDGQKYKGQWEEDNMHGQGIVTWPNGKGYIGHFKNNQPDGQGALIEPDGTKYAGQWKEGQEHGQGIMTWPDGKEYSGGWKGGKTDGQGTIIDPAGTKYEGQWKEGKKHGQGIMTWLNGMKYEGQWKEDKRCGQGIITFPDGAKYEGQWKEGKQHGQGIMTWPNGKQYSGGWKGGQPDGQGQWKEGKKVRWFGLWGCSCASHRMEQTQSQVTAKCDKFPGKKSAELQNGARAVQGQFSQ